MTKFKLLVTKPELDNPAYIILKRKYWITFFDFGWEKVIETTNIDELKPYLPQMIEITRNDTKE